MLVNPYPYISVYYDPPCFIVEYLSGDYDRPCYFFDEFMSRHFGACDIDLSIEVKNFDKNDESMSEYIIGVCGECTEHAVSCQDIHLGKAGEYVDIWLE